MRSISFSLLATVLSLYSVLLWCGPLTVSAHGHLPRAYLPSSAAGSYYGNSSRPDVIAELELFANRLLDDSYLPVGSRTIVNASAFGAYPNDDIDDWDGLSRAFQHACNLSQYRLAEYQVRLQLRLGTLPTLPPGPDDTDARPVLVEVRFDEGVYDLANGPQSVSQCSYLLINGQNSTVRTHFEPNFSPHEGQSAFFDCEDCTFVYLYNFVFTSHPVANTIGQIEEVTSVAGVGVVGFRMTAIPHHTAYSEQGATIQHVSADGAFLNWDQPLAVYGGYQGVNVTLCNGSKEGQVQGCMYVNLTDEAIAAMNPYLHPGLYIGVTRGYSLPLIVVPRAYTVVVQNIRSIGISPHYDAPFWGPGGGSIDLLDIHNDRVLPDAMFVWEGAPVGQTGFTGLWRIWHFSHEADSDDMMDDMAANADVMAINRANNSVTLQVAHGRWVACDNGYGGFVNQTVEVGHFHDPFNPFVTLTIKDIRQFANSSQCGNEVEFYEPIPDDMQVTDVVCGTTAPAHIHFKNVRAGNHAYNQWNVKAHAITMEDCFLYNTTMAGFDISSDVGYWYEGPRANNLLIRNNVFERMNGAIAITPYIWKGPGATDVQAAPSATHNVTIVDNIVWANETHGILGDWFQQYTFDLHAITNLTVRNNTFHLTPGMRRDLPLIRMCNIRGAVLSDNHVRQTPLDVDHPGIDCDSVGSGLTSKGCEPFPASHVLLMMSDSEDAGCRPEFSWDIRVDDDNSWTRAAWHSINNATLLFTAPHFDVQRLNQANAAHSPAILPSVTDNDNVTEYGVADFRNGSQPSNAYIDLLSHWNGAIPPTDGLLLGSADFSLLIRLLLPQLPAKSLRESVLSIGRDGYERLDVQVMSLDSTSMAVQAAWTHNDSSHVTTLQAPSLSLYTWHTVLLVAQDAVYVNSTISATTYSLYVDEQLVDQRTHQPPPKLVIPNAAVLGRPSYTDDSSDYFHGCIARVEVRPINALEQLVAVPTRASPTPPALITNRHVRQPSSS